jgi:glycerol-3-phosphate acyltransferase PlsY
MDNLNELVIFTAVSYLIGSIPAAFLFGKIFKNVDIRKEGSGNIGASNAFRVLGPKIGVLVMAFDIFKGFFPLYLAKVRMTPCERFGACLLIIGLAAVLGHMFPLFLKFKGGKGVATTAGVFLALAPKAAGLCILIWVVLVAASKMASVGSLAAAAALPFAVYYMEGAPLLLTSVSALIGLLVIIMHRKNIKNLIAGKELKINSKIK